MLTHLLQSTAFAAAIGLVTLAFRHNHARTRHALWLAASLKFLIPFSLFISLGSQIHWRRPITAPPQFTFVMTQPSVAPAERPAQAAEPLPTPPPTPTNPIPYLWAFGTLAIVYRWLIRVKLSKVGQTPWSARVPLDPPYTEQPFVIPILLTRTQTEPAVHGILRPVLLLPEAIADRLTPDELRAVIAHELCHVRHRDNLAAAVHMLVEAVFWFHPLVWYIGARLVDERERACDEEVLSSGNSPESYAEAILKVCRFCLESPLPCASGITSADLQQRIVAIMTPRATRRLHVAKKFLLATGAAAAIAAPFAVGLLNAPSSRAQERTAAPMSFEVASVKPVDQPWLQIAAERSGGHIHWTTDLGYIIGYAYRLPPFRITGPVPGSELIFAFDATTDPNATDDQIRLMFQSLLADRFKMQAHRVTKEVDGYALTPGKGGAKIKPAKSGDAAPLPQGFTAEDAPHIEGRVIATIPSAGVVNLVAQGVSMARFCEAMQRYVQKPILDETGLPDGKYYFSLRYAKDDPPAEGVDVSTLAVVLQQQLGLKLERRKGPVEYLVVDHIEKVPTEN